MKLVAFLFLMISSIAAHAQSLYLSPGVEKTVKGALYGCALTYETKSKWGFGAFYQTGLVSNPGEHSLTFKDPFYAVVVQAPLVRTEKLDFLATVRSGIVNEHFFVVVPGLETRIHIWRKFDASFGMGFRMSYPSAAVKLCLPIL